jgi:hypothetical protein
MGLRRKVLKLAFAPYIVQAKVMNKASAVARSTLLGNSTVRTATSSPGRARSSIPEQQTPKVEADYASPPTSTLTVVATLVVLGGLIAGGMFLYHHRVERGSGHPSNTGERTETYYERNLTPRTTW